MNVSNQHFVHKLTQCCMPILKSLLSSQPLLSQTLLPAAQFIKAVAARRCRLPTFTLNPILRQRASATRPPRPPVHVLWCLRQRALPVGLPGSNLQFCSRQLHYFRPVNWFLFVLVNTSVKSHVRFYKHLMRQSLCGTRTRLRWQTDDRQMIDRQIIDGQL